MLGLLQVSIIKGQMSRSLHGQMSRLMSLDAETQVNSRGESEGVSVSKGQRSVIKCQGHFKVKRQGE